MNNRLRVNPRNKKDMETAPSKTMKVHGELMSTFTMELLANDAADCLQIEKADFYLVKVPAREHDLGDCPPDLQRMIMEARTQGDEWLAISKGAYTPAFETDYLH